MNEKLSKILEEARRNPEIKSKFLETRKAQDPMEEFCKVATAIGYDMTVGELFAMGEEYSDNMLIILSVSLSIPFVCAYCVIRASSFEIIDSLLFIGSPVYIFVFSIA